MESRRILLVTDTWEPSTNGVVRSLRETRDQLAAFGHDVQVLYPKRTLPNPIYPDVPLSIPIGLKLKKNIADFAPDHIHIATEGALGMSVRSYCLRKGIRFSTSFHTLWPEYMKNFLRMPPSLTWKLLRWFHRPAAVTMTRSPSMRTRLEARGFDPVREWYGGANLSLFYPRPRKLPDELRPIHLYIGRVSVEKNLEAFLDLPISQGTKMVVGDGPPLKRYREKYPDVNFTGAKFGEELAQAFCEGDVFVFPSLTDTFGRVVIEALACGVPVAAYPVTGPKDILVHPELGATDEDLGQAVEKALLQGDREACAEFAKKYAVPTVTAQFLSHLVPSGLGALQTTESVDRSPASPV